MSRLSDLYPAAIVTGSSSGLGFAFAKMLLEEGVYVIGMSRQPDVFAESSNYEPLSCDFTDMAAVQVAMDDVLKRHPKIRLVINNAGYGVLADLAEQSATSIQQQYSVMLEAPTLIASLAITHFKSAGLGCLVNISSLAVELPLPLMPIYNACKAGLSGLSKSLMLDEVEGRFAVIDFRPGDFNTAFAQRMEGETLWNGVNLREVMDRHHAVAPDVEIAVLGLRRALLRKRSSIVRVGDFFQSKIAPLGLLLPWSWLMGIIRWYYRK